MERDIKRLCLFVSAIILGALFVLICSGCSTVSGFSQFVGGVADDIYDAAEGTRDRMGDR